MKDSILRKLDNILNNANINDDDRAWIEAFVEKGIEADDSHEEEG